MLINRFSSLIQSTNIIRRYKWINSYVSSCETYHVCSHTKKPLYNQRFKIVLPFHSPGLAPVVDQTNAAFHINEHGKYVYSQRFDRTFGFYENLAAVQKSDHWFHIKPDGSPAYKSIWQWCGNFQSYRCPIRDMNQMYYHIDPLGRIISGPHSYAGDFRERSAVVRSLVDGLFRAIDENGQLLHTSRKKTSFFDLDVYHKGLARARDENGWFFIDRTGADTGGGRRYRQIENFYNGQALVQLLQDGSRCIIDEQHRILVRLNDCHDENCADIEQISKAYWPSFALKMGLEQKVNLMDDDKKCTTNDRQLREQIRRVWEEFGLLKRSSNDIIYTLTNKGRLLFESNSVTHDRVSYWLQDRYLTAWLPTSILRKEHIAKKDIFSEIVEQPELIALTQRVLNSYAEQDWHGIASVLPPELFQSSTIVDLGGGVGFLLRELSEQCSKQQLICIDRPEVIRLALAHPRIEFVSGDLFVGSLPMADFYILSRVLHDWSDDKVQIILKRIQAKYLCVIEREVDIDINRHALLSLHMFLINEAKERTRQEWDNLFSTNGWLVQSRTSFSGHMITLLKKDDTNNIRILETLPISPKSHVRRVVLPIAGLGTRMRPQSTILPKVFLPIVQSTYNTWNCRPVLDLLLEEIFAKDTGIIEVLFVIAPDQLHLLQSYFSSYPHQNINFILQQLPKGFGHAVLQVEQYVDNEPFVVMLGDHLYRSNHNNQSCLQQLLNAYRQNVKNSSIIGLTGVMTCTSEEVSETGLLQSNIELKNKQFFEITDMVEKPSIEIAINRFQSQIFKEQFLCQAGIDILPPVIFDLLRHDEKRLQQENKTSELGLREAMNYLRQNGQLRGCLLNGHRYDLGNPKEYYRTFRAFATENKPTTQPSVMLSDAWPFIQNIDQVRSLFSLSDSPIYSARAPGRLDVMGGYADYSGAHVLQYPIAQSTHAFVQNSNVNTIRMMSIQTDNINLTSIDRNKLTIWQREIPMSLLLDQTETLKKRLETWYTKQEDTLLRPNEPINWPNYILGILATLFDRINKTSLPIGFNVVVISDVPCNKGMASSAALEVSVARAASACLNLDNHISNTELALLCQYVENHVVGSSCGFMDQMTCAHAYTDHLFSLHCQHLPNPPFHNVILPSNIQFFAIDSGVKRSTASTAYRRVRTAAFIGRQLMKLPNHIDHLCQISLSQFNNQYRMLLPERMLGRDFQSLSSHLDPLTPIESNEIYSVRAATAHPIEENFRVQLYERFLKVEQDLSTDDLFNLGEFMFQSDAGYVSCDLHSEETQLLVNLIRQKRQSSKTLIGAKITGGGGGGTIAVLTRKSPEAVQEIQNIINQYETLTKRQTRIFSGSSSGLIAYPPRKINT